MIQKKKWERREDVLAHRLMLCREVFLFLLNLVLVLTKFWFFRKYLIISTGLLP